MYRGFTPPTPPASRWINSSSTPITLFGTGTLKTNLSVPRNSAEFFYERNFPSTVEQPVVTEYRWL
jgi:hypothetical protein